MPQKVHVMHGRDHRPGGPDPIPGIQVGGIVYADYVQSFGSLIAYWRLGEIGPPWVDTGGTHDMNPILTGSGLTPGVTGALPAAQDDLALDFNFDSAATSGGQFVRTAATTLFSSLTTMTVAAFVKVGASSIARRADIVSNVMFTTVDIGWALELIYPARTIRFSRNAVHATGAALDTGRWYHIAGSFDGANSRLYVDGVLVATVADTVPSVGGTSEPLRLFGGYSTSASWLVGTVDEVAVWNVALTDTEIATLASVTETGGGVGPPGPAGPAGPAGPGVPVGGVDNQVLTKTSSVDYATAWETPAAGGGGVTVKEDGTVAGTRAGINFHEGAAVANAYSDIASTYASYAALMESSGIGITLADDAANDEVDITLTAGGSLSSGGAGALTLLSTVTLSSAGTFDVASISGAYNDLLLVAIIRASSSGDVAWLRLNNDTGANYATQILQATGSSVFALQTSSSTRLDIAENVIGSSGTAGYFNQIQLEILGYASTTWVKHVFVKSTYITALTAGSRILEQIAGIWNSTSAVTRIQILPGAGTTWVAGSQLRIYGRL